MGRKHISLAHKVSDQADMSANFTSKSTVVEQFDIVAYTMVWVGVGTIGEFFIEFSNDDKVWEALDFGLTLPVGTDTGSDQALIKDVHFKYLRVRYAFTAGTGLIDIVIKSGTKGA